MSAPPLLHLEGLCVSIRGPNGPTAVVAELDLSLAAGQALGLVGESGSGKTTVLRAILGLLPLGVLITSGRVVFKDMDLIAASESDLRNIRGAQIGAIWQDPQAALDPVMRVGDQIAEAVHAHTPGDWDEARARAKELMRMVELPDVERMFRAYPHELSGGQRQRIVLASAIVARPSLLLADEPTTALDVTVQDQVLSLLARLRKELGLALLMVSHDLAVVDQTCDDVAVMYAGRIVESGPAASVFGAPRHHYTAGLLRAAPSVDRPGVRPVSIPGTPSASAVATGCAFAPRCPAADETCWNVTPALTGDSVHVSACHHPLISETSMQDTAETGHG